MNNYNYKLYYRYNYIIYSLYMPVCFDSFHCFIFLETMVILILQFQSHVSIMLELFEKYSSVSFTNILKISIYFKYVLKDIQPKDCKQKNLFLRKAAASIT